MATKKKTAKKAASRRKTPAKKTAAAKAATPKPETQSSTPARNGASSETGNGTSDAVGNRVVAAVPAPVEASIKKLTGQLERHEAVIARHEEHQATLLHAMKESRRAPGITPVVDLTEVHASLRRVEDTQSEVRVAVIGFGVLIALFEVVNLFV